MCCSRGTERHMCGLVQEVGNSKGDDHHIMTRKPLWEGMRAVCVCVYDAGQKGAWGISVCVGGKGREDAGIRHFVHVMWAEGRVAQVSGTVCVCVCVCVHSSMCLCAGN